MLTCSNLAVPSSRKHRPPSTGGFGRPLRVLLAISASVLACLLVFRFIAFFDGPANTEEFDEAATGQVTDKHALSAGGSESASQPEQGAAAPQLQDDRVPDMRNTGEGPLDIETRAISSNAINADFFLDPAFSDEQFAALASEFRAGTSMIGAEEREK